MQITLLRRKGGCVAPQRRLLESYLSRHNCSLQVACEVDSADELVITELIFTNSFSEMDIDQIVALCSCFAYGERSNDDDPSAGLEEALMAPLRVLQEVLFFRFVLRLHGLIFVQSEGRNC